jgi:hypothetical protein
MRTWTVRTIARSGSDYMELTFPTSRPAYRFAIDWFLDDPTLLRIELTDSAGRAEPLVMDRRG